MAWCSENRSVDSWPKSYMSHPGCYCVHLQVNNHMPRNTVVKEQIHAVPLELDGRPVGHQEFVDALMSMSSEDANKTALDLMVRQWGLGPGAVLCAALHFTALHCPVCCPGCACLTCNATQQYMCMPC